MAKKAKSSLPVCPACNNRVSRDPERHVKIAWSDSTGKNHRDMCHPQCSEKTPTCFKHYRKIESDARRKIRNQKAFVEDEKKRLKDIKKKKRKKGIEEKCKALLSEMKGQSFEEHDAKIKRHAELKTHLQDIENKYFTFVLSLEKTVHGIDLDEHYKNTGSRVYGPGLYTRGTSKMFFPCGVNPEKWKESCTKVIDMMASLHAEKATVLKELQEIHRYHQKRNGLLDGLIKDEKKRLKDIKKKTCAKTHAKTKASVDGDVVVADVVAYVVNAT